MVFRPGIAAMLRGCRAHPLAAAVAILTGLLNGASMVLGARAIGWATDHLVLPSFAAGRIDTGAAWIAVAAVVGVCAIRASTIIVRGVATGRVQFGSEVDTRRAVTRSYLSLGTGWHRRHPTGRLLSNAGTDVETGWRAMLFFPFAIGMVFMLLLALGGIALADDQLALLALVLVPVVLGANLINQRVLRPRAERAQRLRAEVSQVAHETFEGDQVVRTLGIGAQQQEVFERSADELRAANVLVGYAGAAFDPVVELAPTGTVLLVLLVGSNRYAAGDLSIGTMVEVCYLLLTAAIPLNVIGRFLGMLPVSQAGMQRVDAVLSATQLHDESLFSAGLSVPGSGARGPLEVRLDDVSLVPCEGAAPVLAGVSLHVPAGSVVAVVGATGSGKSTLLGLAAGLVEPTTGTVRHSGLDVRELAPGRRPETVAVAAQQAFLFADTVRANIRLGVELDDDEIWAALRVAAADGFVAELPGGLDAVLGEGGEGLSGGQQQRLALARAVTRRADLLVLDDATSALDPEVEAAVLGNLAAMGDPDGLASGPTVLLTASRRSSIELAARVVYLERGRVAATGAHDEVYAQAPGYRDLVDAYLETDLETVP